MPVRITMFLVMFFILAGVSMGVQAGSIDDFSSGAGIITEDTSPKTITDIDSDAKKAEDLQINLTPLTPKDNVRVNVSVEPDIVPINEKFTIKMVLVSKWRTSSVSVSVLQPPDLDWASRYGQFSRNYITSENGETLFVYQVSYEYRARKEGEYIIPPIPVRVKNPQTGEEFTVETEPLNVKVFKNVKDMQQQGFDYQKPKSSSPIKSICMYSILILVLLIITLVLLIVLKSVKRKSGKTTASSKKVNDREYYLLKFDELIKSVSNTHIKEVISDTDELIRKWLSLNYDFDAVELTPKEIMENIKEKKGACEDYISRLEYFFDVVDKIKYANQNLDDNEFADFIIRTKEIINKSP
ncbi:MAG: BatD family protein [bacterium]|nr:BatD family protein [bacterium]